MAFKQYCQKYRYAAFMLALISNTSHSLGTSDIFVASWGRRENMIHFTCPQRLSLAKKNFLYLNKMQTK